MAPSADVPSPARAVPAWLVRVSVLVPGLVAVVMIAFALAAAAGAGHSPQAVLAILAWPADGFVRWEGLGLAMLFLLAIAAHPIHPRWWTAILTLAGCVLWSCVGFLVFCAHC